MRPIVSWIPKLLWLFWDFMYLTDCPCWREKKQLGFMQWPRIEKRVKHLLEQEGKEEETTPEIPQTLHLEMFKLPWMCRLSGTIWIFRVWDFIYNLSYPIGSQAFNEAPEISLWDTLKSDCAVTQMRLNNTNRILPIKCQWQFRALFQVNSP